jgi:hypothetical protein
MILLILVGIWYHLTIPAINLALIVLLTLLNQCITNWVALLVLKMLMDPLLVLVGGHQTGGGDII